MRVCVSVCARALLAPSLNLSLPTRAASCILAFPCPPLFVELQSRLINTRIHQLSARGWKNVYSCVDVEQKLCHVLKRHFVKKWPLLHRTYTDFDVLTTAPRPSQTKANGRREGVRQQEG